jgi:hypothetical protein
VTVRAAEQRWLTWHTIDSGRLLLGAATSALVLAALATTAYVGVQDPDIAIAFGLFIAFGELLRLVLPGGREAAPIAMTAAFAYAMVLRIAVPHHPPLTGPPAMQVIAVSALGIGLGALPHVAAGRRAGMSGMCSRLIAIAFVAVLFRPLAASGLLARAPLAQHWLAALTAMAILTALGWLLRTVIVAVLRADDLRARYSVMLVDELAVEWRLGLATGVSAIITVFGAEVMGIAELVVFAGPLLVIQLAFRRYAGIRATYLETVRALARVTEVGGYVQPGHSARVSKLAVAVGRELGMSEPDLVDLEYAALMHDIGQIRLPEPLEFGATSRFPMAKARETAEYGAEVIKQTGVLDQVAELVRCQWLDAGDDPAMPPLGSRVIRVVNAFDDLIEGQLDRQRISWALDRLWLDASKGSYAAGVVAALATVAGRLRRGR